MVYEYLKVGAWSDCCRNGYFMSEQAFRAHTCDPRELGLNLKIICQVKILELSREDPENAGFPHVNDESSKLPEDRTDIPQVS